MWAGRSDPSLKAGMWQKWWCLSSKAWHERPLQFSLSEMVCSRGSQWLCCEDTQAVHVDIVKLRGEELRSLINRQHQLAKCEWVTLKVDLPAPAMSSDDCSLGWHLTAISWKRRLAKAPKVENKIIWQVFHILKWRVRFVLSHMVAPSCMWLWRTGHG